MNVGFASQRYYDVTNTEKKQLAFGAKAPTIDVLEVATNLGLKTDRSYDTEKSLITKMTSRKFNGFERPEIRRQCMGVLTEKIPVLKTVMEDAKNFFGKFGGNQRTDKERTEWVEEKIKLLGSNELDVPEFKVNEEKIAIEANKLRNP